MGGADTTANQEDVFTGTKKIDVDGKSVNVSCSGEAAEGEPVVVLLHGGGDDVEDLAGIQEALSAENRVCSYDRLGAGASDKPDGPQTMETTGNVLTAVLDEVAGDAPAVLAGHSLGGLIIGRYAPEHQDRVAGLVLMDATSPTQRADLLREIPESATGPAVQLRDGNLAGFDGQNPELLKITDGEVRSAGDVPVEVIQHGQQYLAQGVPEYGPGLEQAWADGQRKWLALSSDSNLSTAEGSGHHVYRDAPDLVVEKIQKVAGQVAEQG
ncbi:alpha/beta fold hydrolase [Actinophytocola gossypii]|uniref:alpha/beta fold hydrolase n=1 Tax=Actinophytocola gossypii TaxID=2812003 RepID=UPI0021A2AD5C|nr:alpha/beta hydrolase [Actinophytocola gossypii]